MAAAQPVTLVRRLLRPFNVEGAHGLALLTACLLLVLPVLGGERARLLLRYDRAALAGGQWWRLLTAHVVHLDLRHALVNVLGLALLWALFVRDYLPRQWAVIVAASVAAIDAGLWLNHSTVLWYVGSSGALHGVMAAGVLARARRGEREGWLLGVLLVAKLLYEQVWGALPFSGSDAVIVSAHLYGVLGGALGAACMRPAAAPL
jgi:rhomboid family GlyGly-CTERM serine protease